MNLIDEPSSGKKKAYIWFLTGEHLPYVPNKQNVNVNLFTISCNHHRKFSKLQELRV